jgi:hypothetical protein
MLVGSVTRHFWPPPFDPIYEPSFREDRVARGLGGPNFDHFFQAVVAFLADYPWEYSAEIPNSDGIWMLPTRNSFPDIPPLYVYYRVKQDPNRIVYLGVSPAWSQAETFSLRDLKPPDEDD